MIALYRYKNIKENFADENPNCPIFKAMNLCSNEYYKTIFCPKTCGSTTPQYSTQQYTTQQYSTQPNTTPASIVNTPPVLDLWGASNKCVDMRPNCKAFLDAGWLCDDEHMKTNCRKSCKKCSVSGAESASLGQKACAKDPTCFTTNYPCESCCSTGLGKNGAACWDVGNIYTHGRCCN